MIVRIEHETVGFDCLAEHSLSPEQINRRLTHNSDYFVPGQINLLKYELVRGVPVLKAYYRIGAEWLDDEQTTALVVMPKVDGIDYITMFCTCLKSPATAEHISDIYHIDLDSKPIRHESADSMISPLVAIHFLTLVQRIVSTGLKKGYVSRSENLTKIRGRLCVRTNDRLNIRQGHAERAYCQFQEFSADIPENRLLKRALAFVRIMLASMRSHQAYPTLLSQLNRLESHFANVSDDISPSQVVGLKANKLFSNYKEAIRLAGMILRRYGYSLHKVTESADEVPPFCIDMSLLFEQYVYAMLHEAYGSAVKYQVHGYGNQFIADFLLAAPQLRAVIDTKYIERFGTQNIDGDIVKQLSGYARSVSLLRQLGIDADSSSPVPDIPCVIIYPRTGASTPTNPFKSMPVTDLLTHPQQGIVRFYKFAIQIPTIKLTL